jgi:hypothetical protein
MWGYRPDPRGHTPEEEFETLNEWIVERAHLPWFRSAEAQFGMDVEWDPYRMTEGISDDPVEAADYGMRNLRYRRREPHGLGPRARATTTTSSRPTTSSS